MELHFHFSNTTSQQDAFMSHKMSHKYRTSCAISSRKSLRRASILGIYCKFAIKSDYVSHSVQKPRKSVFLQSSKIQEKCINPPSSLASSPGSSSYPCPRSLKSPTHRCSRPVFISKGTTRSPIGSITQRKPIHQPMPCLWSSSCTVPENAAMTMSHS